MQWQMVKIIGLAVMLSACTTSNTLKPVLSDESYTPMGGYSTAMTIQKSAKLKPLALVLIQYLLTTIFC